jgi:phosphate transport system substrate-binding protein
VGVLSLCGCTSSSSSTEITVAGSTTVLPIAEIAAEKFEAQSGVHVLVSGLGSSAGIEAAMNGTADIASSSRDLTASERDSDLVSTVIAHDGIAIIVNESNPVDDLSMDQLRGIYSGAITNWSEVGGPDLAIQVVNRDEASGTREAFRTIVMGDTSFDRSAAVLPGTGQVRDVVSRTPGAIGYISIGFVESSNATTSVKSLSVGGVEATEANVENGTYPISRELYFFTNGEPTGAAYDYIQFVLSDEMAQTIRDAGYIPVSASAGDAS